MKNKQTQIMSRSVFTLLIASLAWGLSSCSYSKPVSKKDVLKPSNRPENTNGLAGNTENQEESEMRNLNSDCDVLQEESKAGFQSTPLGWLQSQQRPLGLVDSYSDSDNIAYTYDQALSIVAFTAAKDFERARKVLTQMKKLQNIDGSFAASYDSNTGNVLWNSSYSGNNCWMMIAGNYYTICSGDSSFLDIIEKCAGFVTTLIEFDGSLRMETGSTAFSTEHMLDAYSAYNNLFTITGRHRYQEYAQKIRGYLLTEMWATSPESDGPSHEFSTFWAGKNDFGGLVLDAQSWAILSLGDCGSNRTDFMSTLDWILNGPCRVTVDFCVDVAEIDGFDWDEFKKDKKDNVSQNVWFEGTEGVVAALFWVGRQQEAKYFHDQTKRVMAHSGGIPYSTPHHDIFNRSSNKPAVASTAWFYFNEVKINPFWPGNPKSK
ncbi:hypothetical protein HQ585_09620 [candidate division KSB1 bacterium]|nr:hypothetical protein [candidate division KSB1 bacterium]